MLKQRKYIILATVLFLIILSASTYSVYDTKWEIQWDQEMLLGKERYLKAQKTFAHDDSPNIILIVADDLGKSEVSAYGSEYVQTPNIDQLAAEGVLFEEGYVTSPICAPSRAGLLTGRVQNRFGFETQIVDYYPKNIFEYLAAKYLVNMDSWELTSEASYPGDEMHAKQGIPVSEITIAELLQSRNYRTGIVGKWHGGYSDQLLPLSRGFDYQYGFYGAFSLYTSKKVKEGIVNYEHEHFGIKYQWKKGRSENGMIREMNSVITEEDYLTFAIRDRAIQFIENNKGTQQPFFLYVPFSAPHVPFQAPKEYVAKYSAIEDPNKQTYYAMISALDDAVGAIHQKLKDQGMEENTLIVFISDNGGATYTEATTNGSLKGGKTTQFEGGINVPFVIKWKSHIPEALRYTAPVSSTDIFATIASSCQISLPADRRYDGVDLLPYVKGELTERPHQNLFWRADHIWAVRSGDYKLILSKRDGWKELYNLSKDKNEQINLIGQHPEIYQQLHELHLKWQREELPAKSLWPRLVDYKTTIEGKEYQFPS